MSPQEQLARLRHNTVDIIGEDELLDKLKENRPLNVKVGFDPTIDQLHLGWAVVLRKAREFQDLGHKVWVVLGTFTATIGDPSGLSSTRKQVHPSVIMQNIKKMKELMFKILDRNNVAFYFNDNQLGRMTMDTFLPIAAKLQSETILARADFQHRLEAGNPVGLHELLYPIFQALDSVHLKSDVEIGGYDQKLNILLGRDLQRMHDQKPQVAILCPLLVGLDGEKKMSQSLGNYISITDKPYDMFGKVMSIPDHLMPSYLRLATNYKPECIKILLSIGAHSPRDLKYTIAKRIVKMYHGEVAADESFEEFKRVFSLKQAPKDIPELSLPNFQNMWGEDNVELARILNDLKIVRSISAGRRLIQGGAVHLEEKRVEPGTRYTETELLGKLIRFGKGKYFRFAEKVS